VLDDRQVYVVNGTHVGEFTVPGSGGKLQPAVPFAGQLYVADDASGTVYALNSAGALVDTIKIPTSGAPLELTVRSDHLFINAPDSSTARVVDDQHRVKVVDKYANKVLGGDPPPPPPAPPKPPPPPPPPPVGPPGAPTRVTAVAGNASAHISWRAAAANRSPITKYVVEGDGTAHEVGASQLALDVAGLVNGQQYTFTVYAVNGKGPGPKGRANPVVPTSDVPDPPANVKAQEQKDGSVVVSWDAANGQGHKITQYTVTPISGGSPATALTATDTTVTTKPGDLAYGTQYAFTVTAVNDRGASSKASAPSNTVVPFTLPSAPKRAQAQTVDAKGSIAVSWQPADDNGRPVTKYVVSVGDNSQDVTGTDAVTLTGLADGTTVTVGVRAVNEAGAGAQASASAKTISAPELTGGSAGADPSNTYNGLSVSFTTNGNGSATSCTISVNGGAPAGIACTGGKVGGLWPNTTYPFTVTATNKAGGASFSGSVTTAKVTGTVVCTNDSYCGHGSTTGGIWIYPQASQTGSALGNLFAGDGVTPECWTNGANVNAQPYGGTNTNVWLRIPFKGDNYIPYAWVKLDGTTSISNVKPC
jgi:fibronectin type III domain protein